MACGSDWGEFNFSMDAMYEQGAFDTDSWYNGESAGMTQFYYESGISKGEINADALSDAVAGYK